MLRFVGYWVVCLAIMFGLLAAFPDQSLEEMTLGVWGRKVEKSRIVKAGDRIEIYRPLRLDPREARRQLALIGRTMSNPD
jgi:hypothetical protein